MEPVDFTLAAEDFFSDSLQTLYDYQPIALTASGGLFTYTFTCTLDHQHPESCSQPFTISLRTPDTNAANWALHASSIWASSVYLADHQHIIDLDTHIKSRNPEYAVRVLELGASAGLPSIVIAKLWPMVLVTATDYPDEALIKTLSQNVDRNGVAQQCRALPFAWGTDPSLILHAKEKFDVVIAADTLWNPDLHSIFIDALRSTLKKESSARVHVVVGLHTGRYTIQSFLRGVLEFGFDLERVEERAVSGSSIRSWEVGRDGEDEQERRRWIIWIQLRWRESEIELHV
ncbi:hypothetical protein GALMADRAFT_241090 [Galerina marginata CBS 339.88]|uniref:Uncharacterized protein n=1 Tax=Galerina marginata (strain CBS 339.88) TaxID=685588 RepID=A0A067TNZ3_GALM3|nr:hypothetical protein GALMADRAFT_241090 [Galerina marginata CBS 339.88]